MREGVFGMCDFKRVEHVSQEREWRGEQGVESGEKGGRMKYA